MPAEKKKKKPQDAAITALLRAQAAKLDHAVTHIESLSALDKEGFVKAIIESPKGSRNKYDYDPESGLFQCGSALKGGVTFPFDFGFIPSTKAPDGDPLDIIILMDEPAFAGCLVHTRIIGVMEADQTEDGNKFRNDRVIGVHNSSIDYGEYERWQDLPKSVREEIENFFVDYNRCRGKIFKPLGWHGPKTAYELLNQCLVKKRKRAK
jgi:inorganic pyrophosphatase